MKDKEGVGDAKEPSKNKGKDEEDAQTVPDEVTSCPFRGVSGSELPIKSTKVK